MAWYTIPENVTGFPNLMNATGVALESQAGIIGISLIGMSILAPLWFIIFMSLYRTGVAPAWTAASFVSFIIAVFLSVNFMLNPIAIWVLMFMWLGGIVAYYFQSR